MLGFADDEFVVDLGSKKSPIAWHFMVWWNYLPCYTWHMAKGKGVPSGPEQAMRASIPRSGVVPRGWLPARGNLQPKSPRSFRQVSRKPYPVPFRLAISALMLGGLAFLLWANYVFHPELFWGMVVVVLVVILFVLAAIWAGRRREGTLPDD